MTTHPELSVEELEVFEKRVMAHAPIAVPILPDLSRKLIAAARKGIEAQELHVVFDGPPGPTPGRFVEVETPDGRAISVGEWRKRPDGYWALALNTPVAEGCGHDGHTLGPSPTPAEPQDGEGLVTNRRLMPCPFCGCYGAVHHDPGIFHGQTYAGEPGDEGWRVECEGNCHAMTCWWHSEAQAIENWNRRKPTPPGKGDEDWKRRYEDEYAIVGRVWKALGITTYEQAEGKAIQEIVSDITAERDRLRAALEPFQRNVESISLSGALGHIERKHLHAARAALSPAREG